MLIADALRSTTRTVPRVVAAIAGLAVLPTLVIWARGGTDFRNALLIGSVVAGAGFGCVVDDAAARTLASSPTSLLARRGLRAVLAASVLVVAPLVAFAVAATSGREGPALDWCAPFFVASAAIALAVACWLEPDAAVSPGLTAAFVSLIAVLFTGAMATRLSWLPSLQGDDTTRWWLLAAVAGGVALIGSRDPAARLVTRRRR